MLYMQESYLCCAFCLAHTYGNPCVFNKSHFSQIFLDTHTHIQHLEGISIKITEIYLIVDLLSFW